MHIKEAIEIVYSELERYEVPASDNIKNAIESKLRQEQEALAYRFRLDRERSEAERKKIAAEGEAAANRIVSQSLTPNLLKMRGIEATQELANSSNAVSTSPAGRCGQGYR